jgi:hypothetical protein
MPLKLYPPRKARTGTTPYWTVRGTYLGVRVTRSTKTSKRGLAVQILKSLEREIERGEFAQPSERTFASTAAAYMKAGGERTHLKKLLEHFGDRPLSQIGQAEIDAAAVAIYPTASAATVTAKSIPRFPRFLDTRVLELIYVVLGELQETR